MSQLPEQHEPLRLADGRIVMPNGMVVDPKAEQMVEQPTPTEAVKIVVQARRKIADLPDVPKTMNAIGVVLSYTLFGLDDLEIAIATGLSEQQIGRIKLTDAYESMHQSVVQGILAAESDSVRDLFQQHSRDAVKAIAETMKNGRAADRLTAAKDILDRAGHRPADVVEHRHRMDGGLVIEFVRRDDRNDAPTIDMEDGL